MGYGSLLNLPVVISEIGVINMMMAEEGHFSAEALEALEALSAQTPLAAMAVLAHDAGMRRPEGGGPVDAWGNWTGNRPSAGTGPSCAVGRCRNLTAWIPGSPPARCARLRALG